MCILQGLKEYVCIYNMHVCIRESKEQQTLFDIRPNWDLCILKYYMYYKWFQEPIIYMVNIRLSILCVIICTETQVMAMVYGRASVFI